MLTVIIGPMFSGKTSKLLEIAKMHRHKNRKVIIINSNLDSRYTQDMREIVSHDGTKSECFSTPLIYACYFASFSVRVLSCFFFRVFFNEKNGEQAVCLQVVFVSKLLNIFYNVETFETILAVFELLGSNLLKI